MLDETQNYLLSLYQTQIVIKETPSCRVEVVTCSLDEKNYIMRTYPEDKRKLFRVLQRLKGGHIPPIKEVIFGENTTVIEEYIHGEGLDEWIDTGRLHPKQANAMAREILEALKLLHDNQIIHRDIKPENILVDENDHVWLIDFGIARFYDKAARRDTEHLGTIGYAPPEQFGFSQSDFRSDIYAVGVTIEEMGKSAGCLPTSAIMRTAKRCREFDPQRRYTSAVEALNGLNRKKRTAIIAATSIAVLLILISVIFMPLQIESRMSKKDERTSLTHNASVADDDVDQSGEESQPLIGSFDPEENQYRPFPESLEEYFQYTGPDPRDENFIWKEIIQNSYRGYSRLYMAIPDGGSGYGTAALAEGLNPSDISVELKDGTLTVKLDDHTMPQEEFVFSYVPERTKPYPYDEDLRIDAEIVFADMNNDNQLEMVVALCERQLIEGGGGAVWDRYNWSAAWCIGYTPEEGFWLAEGMVVSHKHRLQIGPIGARQGPGSYLDLVGREWMD